MEYCSTGDVDNKYSNACCCCLNGDCSMDISSEYNYCGQREVYETMLKDTLNIQVSSQASDPSHRWHICEPCVSRLRDASAFRQMVLCSQDVFREHLERLTREGPTSNIEAISVSEIKVEQLPPDDASCDDAVGFGDEDFNDDEILANLKSELEPRTRREPRGRLKKGKTKDDGIVARFAKDAGSSPASILFRWSSKLTSLVRDVSQKDWSRIVERRGAGPALRENSLKLLANSTLCVFQWNKSRYRCFCCKEPFSELASLRDHSTKHSIEEVEKKIIVQQNRLVKVEVSVITCKICSKTIEDLTNLREHLTKDHKIEFVQTEDLLVPFKINGQLQCQLCSEQFNMFRLLNIHMNRHYQNHVCHICGAGFSNSVFLNLHKTRSHKPFHCKQCDLIFTSKSEKKNHDTTVHGVKFERKLRFPCPYCSLRFFQENFRVKHLVEKHGLLQPEYKCSVCAKVFITKSLCNNHVKSVHMKEKNHECDLCHKLFYNKYDVARHRVTHTGEKKFACGMCNSPFATKDSLRRHARRTHGGMQ